MENVLEVEADVGWGLVWGISFITLLLGLLIGIWKRQVICRTLQPIVHNIHHLIPICKEEAKEEEAKEEEAKEEEVKEDTTEKKDD